MTRIAAAFLAALACAAAAGPVRAQGVLTYHNTPDRGGAYTVPGLTLAAAAKLHLDGGFHATLTGNVYAQPLYWKPAGAMTGLVIVATESNLVYALDENTGATVWRAKLSPPASRSILGCGDINPEGVTGAPVIDPAGGTLYLDALIRTPDNAPKQKIYAISLASGKVLQHWPIDVENQVAALHGAFSSRLQGERSALQFQGGRLYVNYGGRAGDCGPYHGVVVEFNPTTRRASALWTTRAVRGGIWSQGGASSDGVSLFVTTGNTQGASSWGDGEAVIRLKPGLAHSTDAKNYFTPSNWQDLDNSDLDLGGTAAVLFTVPIPSSRTASRLLTVGKDGYAYLMDAANLGGIGNPLAKLQVSTSRVITAPAALKTATGTLVAFTNFSPTAAGCTGSSLEVLKVTADAASPIAPLWCAPLAGSGAPILTTTNGSGNAIFWVTGAQNDNLLHGYDALTGKAVFSGGGAVMAGLHHYSTPIAANRRLYVAADGTVYAFTF
jgi:hypothetical protein